MNMDLYSQEGLKMNEISLVVLVFWKNLYIFGYPHYLAGAHVEGTSGPRLVYPASHLKQDDSGQCGKPNNHENDFIKLTRIMEIPKNVKWRLSNYCFYML